MIKLSFAKEREKKKPLTTPKSLDVTKLTFLLPPSASSTTFQTLTSLSVPPVTKHPFIWGFTSREDTAPSCADNVNRAGEGVLRSLGRVRASKFSTRPFSRDTYTFE